MKAIKNDSAFARKYIPFAYYGEVDLTRPTHIFPTFITHDVSKTVAKHNFAMKRAVRKSKCTKKTPMIRYKTPNEESLLL